MTHQTLIVYFLHNQKLIRTTTLFITSHKSMIFMINMKIINREMKKKIIKNNTEEFLLKCNVVCNKKSVNNCKKSHVLLETEYETKSNFLTYSINFHINLDESVLKTFSVFSCCLYIVA